MGKPVALPPKPIQAPRPPDAKGQPPPPPPKPRTPQETKNALLDDAFHRLDAQFRQEEAPPSGAPTPAPPGKAATKKVGKGEAQSGTAGDVQGDADGGQAADDAKADQAPPTPEELAERERKKEEVRRTLVAPPRTPAPVAIPHITLPKNGKLDPKQMGLLKSTLEQALKAMPDNIDKRELQKKYDEWKRAQKAGQPEDAGGLAALFNNAGGVFQLAMKYGLPLSALGDALGYLVKHGIPPASEIEGSLNSVHIKQPPNRAEVYSLAKNPHPPMPAYMNAKQRAEMQQTLDGVPRGGVMLWWMSWDSGFPFHHMTYTNYIYFKEDADMAAYQQQKTEQDRADFVANTFTRSVLDTWAERGSYAPTLEMLKHPEQMSDAAQVMFPLDASALKGMLVTNLVFDVPDTNDPLRRAMQKRKDAIDKKLDLRALHQPKADALADALDGFLAPIQKQPGAYVDNLSLAKTAGRAAGMLSFLRDAQKFSQASGGDKQRDAVGAVLGVLGDSAQTTYHVDKSGLLPVEARDAAIDSVAQQAVVGQRSVRAQAEVKAQEEVAPEESLADDGDPTPTPHPKRDAVPKRVPRKAVAPQSASSNSQHVVAQDESPGRTGNSRTARIDDPEHAPRELKASQFIASLLDSLADPKRRAAMLKRLTGDVFRAAELGRMKTEERTNLDKLVLWHVRTIASPQNEPLGPLGERIPRPFAQFLCRGIARWLVRKDATDYQPKAEVNKAFEDYFAHSSPSLPTRWVEATDAKLGPLQ